MVYLSVNTEMQPLELESHHIPAINTPPHLLSLFRLDISRPQSSIAVWPCNWLQFSPSPGMAGWSYASNWHFAHFSAVWSRTSGSSRQPILRGRGHLHPDRDLDEGTAPEDKFWHISRCGLGERSRHMVFTQASDNRSRGIWVIIVLPSSSVAL